MRSRRRVPGFRQASGARWRVEGGTGPDSASATQNSGCLRTESSADKSRQAAPWCARGPVPRQVFPAQLVLSRRRACAAGGARVREGPRAFSSRQAAEHASSRDALTERCAWDPGALQLPQACREAHTHLRIALACRPTPPHKAHSPARNPSPCARGRTQGAQTRQEAPFAQLLGPAAPPPAPAGTSDARPAAAACIEQPSCASAGATVAPVLPRRAAHHSPRTRACWSLPRAGAGPACSPSSAAPRRARQACCGPFRGSASPRRPAQSSRLPRATAAHNGSPLTVAVDAATRAARATSGTSRSRLPPSAPACEAHGAARLRQQGPTRRAQHAAHAGSSL